MLWNSANYRSNVANWGSILKNWPILENIWGRPLLSAFLMIAEIWSKIVSMEWKEERHSPIFNSCPDWLRLRFWLIFIIQNYKSTEKNGSVLKVVFSQKMFETSPYFFTLLTADTRPRLEEKYDPWPECTEWWFSLNSVSETLKKKAISAKFLYYILPSTLSVKNSRYNLFETLFANWEPLWQSLSYGKVCLTFWSNYSFSFSNSGEFKCVTFRPFSGLLTFQLFDWKKEGLTL